MLRLLWFPLLDSSNLITRLFFAMCCTWQNVLTSDPRGTHGETFLTFGLHPLGESTGTGVPTSRMPPLWARGFLPCRFSLLSCQPQPPWAPAAAQNSDQAEMWETGNCETLWRKESRSCATSWFYRQTVEQCGLQFSFLLLVCIPAVNYGTLYASYTFLFFAVLVLIGWSCRVGKVNFHGQQFIEIEFGLSEDVTHESSSILRQYGQNDIK